MRHAVPAGSHKVAVSLQFISRCTAHISHKTKSPHWYIKVREVASLCHDDDDDNNNNDDDVRSSIRNISCLQISSLLGSWR
jgi:hypothetical protein